MVKVVRNQEGLEPQLQQARDEKKRIAFIPTMGALHNGHMALIEKAAKTCEYIVVSIFVNPTQFNESDDFEKYPRDENADIFKLKETACSLVYIPEVSDIYPDKKPKLLDYYDEMFDAYEGVYRPGHFRGVVTVVMRFFDIIEPDEAYFGYKDIQQYRLIKKASAYYGKKTKVVGVETQREDNGLAMSSRNFRLSSSDKKLAGEIYKSLSYIAQRPNSSPKAIAASEAKRLKNLNIAVEYLEVCDLEKIRPVDSWQPKDENVVMFAAKVNGVRLIDNLMF